MAVVTPNIGVNIQLKYYFQNDRIIVTRGYFAIAIYVNYK